MQRQDEKTIAAIATAFGPAAISIVRISGKDAIGIVNKIFSRDLKKVASHTMHFGKILDKDKNTIDTVLLSFMKGPNSYTGEDSIEIYCHGGVLITKKVFERVLEAGAFPAAAGEFSLRSFLNNKMDLVQAEAVQSLISAQSDLALKAAKNQLEGALSKKIKKIQQLIVSVCAIVEAYIDFPEEDLDPVDKDEIDKNIDLILENLLSLSNSFYDGKLLSEGPVFALVGSVNVGKSSLMNILCNQNRAIVTNIPGTTRDTLEESITIKGINLKLIDTAGIRKTKDEIEKEGIARSKKAIEHADFILFILDASLTPSSEEIDLLKNLPKEKTIVVWNKVDLNPNPKKLEHFYEIPISAKKDLHIDILKDKIIEIINQNMPQKDEVFLTQKRHKKALENTIFHIQNAQKKLSQAASYDLVAEDIRSSLENLSEICKIDVTENVLSEIFSKFCVGK